MPTFSEWSQALGTDTPVEEPVLLGSPGILVPLGIVV